MKKIVIVSLYIMMLLSGCRTSDPNMVDLEEVLSAFKEQNLLLEVTKVPTKNIFGMKLNRVRPDSYKLDDKLLLIYMYTSIKEREKALQDFRNKTATFNLVSFTYYEVKNVLIFYVHGLDLSKKVAIDEKIQKVVGELNEQR
ncbi:hypothetical protein KHA93_10255 [Bacillus sp. FJAT-49732]|uniref:Uncharacterized protein n=1 Tax=Lederbergia citrisecunda TaxID=2833583 RepID=A0A942TNM8_9BACI|nr:hypothetical protein [Lederbergia citrisecunda]MBS4200037.1 hypothetical protein [Lederbergia citrisecunda]